MQKTIYILTHPVQYYAPLFRYLYQVRKLDFEALYLTTHGVNEEFDKEFGVKLKWDTPLLNGYPSSFLKNNSWQPGIYRGFFGIINLELISFIRKLPAESIIIVPGWNNFSYVLALVVGKVFGHRVCLRAENPLIHEIRKPALKMFIRKLILGNLLFKLVHKFLFIGRQNKLFYEYYRITQQKLIFTPYAVDNDYFSEQREILIAKKQTNKALLNISEHAKVILYSGKLIGKKRPLDLLQAFSKIQDKVNGCLIFMGDGELRVELEDFISHNNITNVIITGFVNQSMVSTYYSIADVFVMCSEEGETWGLSTNEAMNFAVPIVISDLTGCAYDLVMDNGFMFTTGNVELLAENLVAILNLDDARHKEMGETSLRIIKNYSFEKIAEGLSQI